MKQAKTKYNEYPAYLKTDILPFEISVNYSNDQFYDYILKNSRVYNKILKEKNTEYITTIPYTFKSYVRDDKVRNISIINPYSYFSILRFIKNYETYYLSLLKSSPYSIRYPSHQYHNYAYDKYVRSNQYYNDDVNKIEKKNGTYYKIEKYKRSYEFENSKKFQNLMIDNRYFIKMDIKSCFDTIYTHMYCGLLADNYKGRMSVDKKHLYPQIDKLLQSINCHKTNGILVGPEFMRLMAEVLLSGIDSRLYKKKINAKVFRFIDDYYVFTNDRDVYESLPNLINDELFHFNLSLNEHKLLRFDDYFDLNEWYIDVKTYIEQIDHYKFYNQLDRRYLFSLFIKYKEKRATIVAFILSSVINSNIKNLRKIEKIEQIDDYNSGELKIYSDKSIFSITNELLYYLELSPKYINILKIFNFIVELLIVSDKLNNDGFKNNYKTSIINSFNLKFNFENLLTHCHDYLNFILLFEILEYKIPLNIVEKLVSKDDVFIYAQLMRYLINTGFYPDVLNGIKSDVSYRKSGKVDEQAIWYNVIFPDELDELPNHHNHSLECEYINHFLKSGNYFFDFKKIEDLEELKILNKKIYYKSLININY